ncbi:MAG: non-ribosomal peptide synthetase [Nitrospinae bacterium]|nr:non-ribosomal peptide synthetase [Nitrospinota bacterium]
MAGYYDNPVSTQDAFCGEWLRTGDLGFMREGRLCVTGRAKDIIFISGRNFYAHDLENVAQKVEGGQSHRIAICGWRGPEAESDKLLLFLAAPKPAAAAAIFLKLKKQLQEVLGLTVDIAVPVKSGGFPKTSSGKLQRYKLVERFEQGTFDEDIEKFPSLLKAEEEGSPGRKIPPRTFTEKLLHKFWCEELLLSPEEVGIRDTFAELSSKSIHAVSILAGLENYNIFLDSQIIKNHQSIAEIAGYIDKHPARVRCAEGGKRKKVFGG